MTQLFHRVTILAISLASAATLQAGKDFLNANWESHSGFRVSTEAVLPEKEIHPSLWFSEEGLAAFKTQLNADATIREYWTKVKNHPLLTAPFPEVIPDAVSYNHLTLPTIILV